MTEIQGKSILVWVSARFELVRVRVIGSRLYDTMCFPRMDGTWSLPLSWFTVGFKSPSSINFQHFVQRLSFNFLRLVWQMSLGNHNYVHYNYCHHNHVYYKKKKMSKGNVTLALIGSRGLFCSFFNAFSVWASPSWSPVVLKPCALRMSLNSSLPTFLGAWKIKQYNCPWELTSWKRPLSCLDRKLIN